MRIFGSLLICLTLLTAKPVIAQNIDLRLLQHINGPTGSADGLWRGVSNSDYVFVMATPATMLITGIAQHNQTLKAEAFETGGAVLLSQGATVLLKDVIHRQRPYLAYPNIITGKMNSTDSSFPSGHTSAAFATATSLSLAFPKWYVIAPSFAYAGAVGYSRMYLGVHYPSDVLAGAVIGAGSAFLTFKLQHWLEKKIP
ncbi:undecaprenyl-diphosphatase [Mucilaginibacter yixingensis]|uniref:Undecaprenyl-diphosphatase n=1 Tax=Mucilaginibacter yixingensis TaxID=1295612 RepID=A0A2T5JGW6_9SPHI|nr:phosphatase PAP2 family protein [Mucilaginibacter yixingensis]PTR01683.1 undecaprenyl-diphosphatase [Mucilaginibacter yixingensis]